jgi:CrcB protein
MNYLLVFFFGGLGSVLRYLMGPAVQRSFEGWMFPIGTFSVNMLGCFVIGLLGQLAESKGMFTGDMRAAVFVGLLGGFTTFSSFGFETFQLIRDGQFLYAAANALLQLVLGLLCVWLGFIVGRLV